MDNRNFTALLYFKSDASRFILDNPTVKNIYPLTPNAKSVISNSNKNKIVDPLKIFTKKSHLKVCVSSKRVEKIVHLYDHLQRNW